MIGIITDSTCDIPEHLVNELGIIVVPQIVIWGEEQYQDRVDLQPIEFYQRLITDPVRPRSSMPTITNFQDAFKTAQDQGAKELIVLTVSSAMSGTYQVAKNAAELAEIQVTVIDSKGPTMSLGWQTLAAARARGIYQDVSSIVKKIDQVRKNLIQLVAMETVEYLQKGGRIGEAARWAGTLLKVRPLVSINHQKGVVEPVSLARTHKSLVDLLIRKFLDYMSGHRNPRVAILHGNNPQEAQMLAELIANELNPVELLINITGPVLGINTGPGALALCGYFDD